MAVRIVATAQFSHGSPRLGAPGLVAPRLVDPCFGSNFSGLIVASFSRA